MPLHRVGCPLPAVCCGLLLSDHARPVLTLVRRPSRCLHLPVATWSAVALGRYHTYAALAAGKGTHKGSSNWLVNVYYNRVRRLDARPDPVTRTGTGVRLVRFRAAHFSHSHAPRLRGRLRTAHPSPPWHRKCYSLCVRAPSFGTCRCTLACRKSGPGRPTRRGAPYVAAPRH